MSLLNLAGEVRAQFFTHSVANVEKMRFVKLLHVDGNLVHRLPAMARKLVRRGSNDLDILLGHAALLREDLQQVLVPALGEGGKFLAERLHVELVAVFLHVGNKALVATNKSIDAK